MHTAQCTHRHDVGLEFSQRSNAAPLVQRRVQPHAQHAHFREHLDDELAPVQCADKHNNRLGTFRVGSTVAIGGADVFGVHLLGGLAAAAETF